MFVPPNPYSYQRPSRIFDWQREQVFEGYNPVFDGFAYPIEDAEDCHCTIIPSAGVCEPCRPCLDRVQVEAERFTAA